MWNPFSPIVQAVKDLWHPSLPEAVRLNLDGLDRFEDARYEEGFCQLSRQLAVCVEESRMSPVGGGGRCKARTASRP